MGKEDVEFTGRHVRYCRKWNAPKYSFLKFQRYFLLVAEREEFELPYDSAVHPGDGGADGFLAKTDTELGALPAISIRSAISRTTGEAGKSCLPLYFLEFLGV